MFCTNCGCKNSDDANYCKKCGTKLEPPEEAAGSDEATEENVSVEETAPSEEDLSAAEEKAAAARTAENTDTTVTPGATAGPENTAEPENAETPETVYIHVDNRASDTSASLSGLGQMLKLGISSPLKAVKEADKDSNWLSGLLIFLITDLLLSLIITAAIGSVLMYAAGNSMNIAGLDLSLAGYSSGAVFLTALLLLLLSDVLEIFIIFGIGKAFGSKASLKSWIAVCATSQILFRLLSMIAVLIMMAGYGGMVIATIMICIGALSYLLLMFKAFEVSTKLEHNKLFYGFICAYLVYIIAFSIVTGVISGINAANTYSNPYDITVPDNDFFNDNSF